MQKLLTPLQNSLMWQRAKNWYELLEARDRRVVQLVSVAIVCTLIYVLIWSPVREWSDKQEADYKYQVDMSHWLQNNKSQAIQLQKNQKAGIGQRELSSVVGSVARRSEVALSRVQPDHKGLSVWVEDAAYQKLLMWLGTLENKHNIQVQQIRIDKLKEEGRVKASLRFAK